MNKFISFWQALNVSLVNEIVCLIKPFFSKFLSIFGSFTIMRIMNEKVMRIPARIEYASYGSNDFVYSTMSFIDIIIPKAIPIMVKLIAYPLDST